MSGTGEFEPRANALAVFTERVFSSDGPGRGGMHILQHPSGAAGPVMRAPTDREVTSFTINGLAS